MAEPAPGAVRAWVRARPAGSLSGDLTEPRGRDGQTSGWAPTPASVSAEGWRCAFARFSSIARPKEVSEWSATLGWAVPGAWTKGVCGRLRDALLEPVLAPGRLLDGPGKGHHPEVPP